MAVAPGWYADPEYSGYLRWWDGLNWTSYREPNPAPVAQPARLEQPARSRPKRARGWILLGAGVAAMALLLGAVFSVGFTKASATSASTSSATTSTSTVSRAFGELATPDGTVPATSNTRTSTVAAALATGARYFPAKLLANSDCAGLDYVQPVTTRDPESSDPLLVLRSYENDRTSPTVVVSATVRIFSSPAKAQAHLDALNSLLDECHAGSANRDGKVQLTGESAGFGIAQSASWTQTVASANGGKTEFETVNFLQGSTLVRVGCTFTPPQTQASGPACSSWTSEIADTLARVG